MAILALIQELCEEANANYTFEFENERMENVLADNLPFPLAFFEEYTESRYLMAGFGLQKETLVELHLMRLCPMESDAIVREQLREQIEAEFVIPFLRLLHKSKQLHRVSEVSVVTPIVPRFDANAVDVMLRFWVKTNVC